MKTVLHSDTDAALRDSKRVYLCGNLAAPNGLAHIPTDGFELGISDYKAFTAEAAHTHTENGEYNYILAGHLKVYIFHEKKEYTLSAGDLFLIEPHMPYCTKALAGTRVLFAKTPGGNDKQLNPELDALLENWKTNWEAEV